MNAHVKAIIVLLEVDLRRMSVVQPNGVPVTVDGRIEFLLAATVRVVVALQEPKVAVLEVELAVSQPRLGREVLWHETRPEAVGLVDLPAPLLLDGRRGPVQILLVVAINLSQELLDEHFPLLLVVFRVGSRKLRLLER